MRCLEDSESDRPVFLLFVQNDESSPARKPKVWEKQKKKKGKGGKGKKKPAKQHPVYIVNKAKPAIANVGASSTEKHDKTDSPTANGVSAVWNFCFS